MACAQGVLTLCTVTSWLLAPAASLVLPWSFWNLPHFSANPGSCSPPQSTLMGQVGVCTGCTGGSSPVRTCCVTLAVPSPVRVATPALILTWLL